MEGNLIEVRGLKHQFPGAREPAVQIDRLDLPVGRVTALTGPNGSGKTTLLKILGGLITPDRGQVIGVNGHLSAIPTGADSDMSVFLHQEPVLFRGSVFKNVSLPLRLQHRGVRFIAASLCRPSELRHQRQRYRFESERALERVGLSGWSRRRTAGMSGGEKKRTALARTLLCHAPIYLLDEPDSGIDARSREIISRLIRELKSEGATVIFTSHQESFVCHTADQIIQLEEGRLVDPELNLIHGQLRSVDRGLGLFESGSGSFLLSEPASGVSRAVLHYSDIVLSPEPLSSSMRNQLQAVVTAVEPAGPGIYLVTLDCGFTLKTRITARSRELFNIRPGIPVYAGFKATAVKAY